MFDIRVGRSSLFGSTNERADSIRVSNNRYFNFLFNFHRYSGELSDFGTKLDELATLIWENVSFRNVLSIIKQYKIFLSFSLCDPYIKASWRKVSSMLPHTQQRQQ